MKININDIVKVKLTEHGEKVWGDFWNNIFEYKEEYEIPHIAKDSDGYTKFRIWDLMNIYGEEMWMGNPNTPFEAEMIYENK